MKLSREPTARRVPSEKKMKNMRRGGIEVWGKRVESNLTWREGDDLNLLIAVCVGGHNISSGNVQHNPAWGRHANHHDVTFWMEAHAVTPIL